MNHYAQINKAGLCVGLLETPGTVEADHMLLIQPGDANIGQRWTGTAWETIAPTEKELALRELEQIDQDTGMSRSMRELMISMAEIVGADVTFLKAKEAQAIKAREKLKA